MTEPAFRIAIDIAVRLDASPALLALLGVLAKVAAPEPPPTVSSKRPPVAEAVPFAAPPPRVKPERIAPAPPVAHANGAARVGRKSERWTPARKALLAKLYPSDVGRETICRRLNELSGDPVTADQMSIYATNNRLQRPAPDETGKIALPRAAVVAWAHAHDIDFDGDMLPVNRLRAIHRRPEFVMVGA